MSYFTDFPTVFYEFPDSSIKQYTDLSIRPAVVDELLNSSGSLEPYQVSDGETPETIAYDLYGDPAMHWTIMLANNIMNLYTDWPKSDSLLRTIVMEKYRTQIDSNGIERELNDLEVAEYIEFAGEPENGYMSVIETAGNVPIHPHHFVDDNDNYYAWGTQTNNVDAFGRTIDVPTLYPVSIWDYEVALNEENRFIFVPTTGVANKMKRELRDLVNG